MVNIRYNCWELIGDSDHNAEYVQRGNYQKGPAESY